MFERYTERARRVLFFARYEASQLGSPSIGPEHLLLGILHEGGGLAARICREAGLDFLQAHIEVAHAFEDRPKISTSVEMPLSTTCKAALTQAAVEADGLKHAHVGTEHLLLGLLAEPESLAAGILTRGGLDLTQTREVVRARYGTPSQDALDAAARRPAPTREAHVVLVQVTIRPEMQAEFERALLHNARESVRLDRGCLRFDVSQDKDDPAKWVLYEVYDGPAAHAAHRQSPHFLAYDAVATTAVVEKVVSKCAGRHMT
jgi:quinol monooxygenase YgiN